MEIPGTSAREPHCANSSNFVLFLFSENHLFSSLWNMNTEKSLNMLTFRPLAAFPLILILNQQQQQQQHILLPICNSTLESELDFFASRTSIAFFLEKKIYRELS